MNIDREKINRIGIDRVTLEVPIISIDSSKLDTETVFLGLATEEDRNYSELLDTHTGEIMKLKKLKAMYRVARVTDSTEDRDIIKYGIETKSTRKSIEGVEYTMAKLDVVLGRVAYSTDHNIYNVNDEQTIITTFSQIIRELSISGISIMDMDNWLITSMEVNKTVETEYSLKYYEQIMHWAFEQIMKSRKYKSRGEFETINKDGSSSLTYSCITKRRDLKIYDKTNHLKDTLELYIDENLIRCEVTWNKEGIHKEYKSLNAMTVLTNLDKLTERYNKALDSIIDIIRASAEEEVDKLYSQLEQATIKTLKAVYNNNDMFDVVFLISAAERKYKEEGKSKNFSRDIKKLLNSTVQIYKRDKYKDLLYILTAFRTDTKLLTLGRASKKYIN